TDKLVTSIIKLRAQAIFRLGRSEGANPQPPPDFDRYADIAKHIVLHYNGGWANGYRYGIRYWEIWNEPDLGKVFWGGSAEQYFSLYAKIARAVKQADPHALVGGPAIARPNDDSAYRDAFMAYVQRTHTPLDFYSWHWYATDSDDPGLRAHRHRPALAARPSRPARHAVDPLRVELRTLRQTPSTAGTRQLRCERTDLYAGRPHRRGHSLSCRQRVWRGRGNTGQDGTGVDRPRTDESDPRAPEGYGRRSGWICRRGRTLQRRPGGAGPDQQLPDPRRG